MTPAIPFLASSSISGGAWIIFAVAAFCALCAVVCYLVAANMENNRKMATLRAMHEDGPSKMPGTPDGPPPSDAEGTHHLEWPGGGGDDGGLGL